MAMFMAFIVLSWFRVSMYRRLKVLEASTASWHSLLSYNEKSNPKPITYIRAPFPSMYLYSLTFNV